VGHDGLDPVRALLPGVRIDAPDELGGNERTRVVRVRARRPDGTRTSYIVKLHRSAGEGWVREAAALSVLPPRVHAPRVAVEGREPPVLVIEDLGAGPSVADALTGDDPQTAEAAVQAWAAAIARLHAATRGLREAFRAALTARQGDLPVADSHVSIDLEDAVRALDRACTTLEVRVPGGAFDELRGLAKRLGGSGLAALTPADACPDNNVRTDGGLVLVDFEGAQWRHLAWDVAYLQVPWPTCWCSWRMPDSVAERAVQAYLQAAAPDIPEVAGEAFRKDVEAAVVGWALVTTAWFLDNALGSDPPLNPARPTPTRRAMILHRLDKVAGRTELAALGELSGTLAAELRSRWGDVPLAFAPAFRAAQ
jgi:Phosphotransferase enzyme family